MSPHDRVILTPIEPGSRRVKGTDLLLLRNFWGEWQLTRLKAGSDILDSFATLDDARWYLSETNEGAQLVADTRSTG